MQLGKAQRGRLNLRASSHQGMNGGAARRLWIGLLVGFALPLSACGGTCRGDDCGCDGQEECIIDCQRDGCELECQNAGDSCGAICGDDCDFECAQTNHCSSYSGDDSVILCRNLQSCAADCGAGCDYRARQVDKISITVGEDSFVECDNLSRCEVECLGSCEVEITQVGSWEVECEDGTQDGGGVSETVTVTCD